VLQEIYDPRHRPRIGGYTIVPRPAQNDSLFRGLKVGAVERHHSIVGWIFFGIACLCLLLAIPITVLAIKAPSPAKTGEM